MTQHARTFGEALGISLFNASDLPPERVAELFVKSDNLERLTSKDNAILVGPRGSGKTTLMKMLTRTALDKWDTPLAQQLLERPILPLYIGSDIVARSQLLIPERTLSKQSDIANFTIVRRAKLSLHFLLTVLEVVSHEIEAKRALAPNHDEEDRVVTRLSSAYRLRPVFPSLIALSDAANNAILLCSRVIQDAAAGETRDLRRTAREVAMPGLSDLITATRDIIVEGIEGTPRKWLLLFDEIEYLPKDSQEEILQLIRTLGPNFGTKIAFTPLAPSSNYFSDAEKSFMHAGHEYLPITLAPSESRELLEFSKDFCFSMLSKAYEVPLPELSRVFGVSAFADHRVGAKLPKAFHTVDRLAENELVASLARKQPRFEAYAEKSGFLGEFGVDALSSVERSSRFRKALPIMMLWNERLRPSSNVGTKGIADQMFQRFRTRSRKSHRIYTGYPTVLLLADGNPRVMMQMLSLLPWNPDKSNMPNLEKPMFSVEDQDESIENARIQQLTLANTYLGDHGRVLNDLFGLDVIHSLGHLFEEYCHQGPRFNPDPPSSFFVDRALDEALEGMIVDAVYTGALVELRAIGDRPVLHLGEGPVGRRFRLGYLQGTHYWLPVRKGRQVAFSSLLKRIESEQRPYVGTAFAEAERLF